MDRQDINRRDFLQQSVAGVAAAGLWPAWAQATANSAGEIPKRPLGKTGIEVPILALGGYHIGRVRDDNESVRLVRRAIDLGVTFLDNAWHYNNGRSEEMMGKALQDGYREKVFLMTKHHGRDRATAMQHLETSLRRLQTDVIDLWQFHEIIHEDDPDMIFGPDGGIEAAELAKKQGKVRFIGFTGHKDPAYLVEMLAHGYDWDTVQMPINVLDAHFQSFQRNVLPILTERNIGVIGMKSIAGGQVLQSGVATVPESLRYAWSQPIASLVSGMGSIAHLEQNVQAARNFTAYSQEEIDRLLERSAPAATDGRFERFKVTREHDSNEVLRLHQLA